MSAIEKIKSEDGFALLNTLIIILFLGLMAVTVSKLVVIDIKEQAANMNKTRAFYAAQSGIEYAIKGLEKSAPYYSNMAVFNNYKENISTGGGTSCIVKIFTHGIDSIRIVARGISGDESKIIIKGIRYIDISRYAVYASGDVKYVRTIPSGRIMKNAPKMPLFDMDKLRNLAKPGFYFPKNLIIKTPFNFYSKNFVFVENNLIFKKFTWFNSGNYVVGHHILLQKSWLPFGSNWGTFYLPNPNSRFDSQWMLIARFLIGGMIVNGDVRGTDRPFWFYRYTVIHNRTYINNLMKLSVNEGPLVFWNGSWTQI